LPQITGIKSAFDLFISSLFLRVCSSQALPHLEVNYRRSLLQGLVLLSGDEKLSNTPGIRRLRKSANSDYQFRHLCPFLRIELLASHWTDFREILYLSIFRKYFEKV
jgi:hypothetical protein